MNDVDRKLIALFHTEIPLTKIAKMVNKRTTYVNKVWALTFGSKSVDRRKRHIYSLSKLGDNNPQTGKRGEDAANYKHGYWVRNGYKYVPIPDWYDGPNHAGYAREHVLVYCERENLSKIPNGLHVHHINLDKLDNSPHNLIALSNRDHQLLHAWLDSEGSVETISQESRPRGGRPKRTAPEKGDDIVHATTEVVGGTAVPELPQTV